MANATKNQTDISALESIFLLVGEAIGLIAHKQDMKFFANQDGIDLQVQNTNFSLSTKYVIKVDSVDGKVTITATDTITFIFGSTYIKISSKGIELDSQGNPLF